MARKPARVEESKQEAVPMHSDHLQAGAMDEPEMDLDTGPIPTPSSINLDAVEHIRAAIANLKANAPDRGLVPKHVRVILKLEAAERMIHQRS